MYVHSLSSSLCNLLHSPVTSSFLFGPSKDEVTGEWRRLHNEELNDVYSSPNIVRVIKSRTMRLAGHVARMGEERGLYRVLVGKPDERRPLGRPRRRWVDNIRMDLQQVWCGYVDWIGLDQDRDRWRTLVSAVMNLWVPWNAGNFFTSCKPVSFSRRTLDHGVRNYVHSFLSFYTTRGFFRRVRASHRSSGCLCCVDWWLVIYAAQKRLFQLIFLEHGIYFSPKCRKRFTNLHCTTSQKN